MKYFDVSPLNPRVRDLQAKHNYSLSKAVNIIKLEDIQRFLKRGGDTVTVVHALTDIIQQMIQKQE